MSKTSDTFIALLRSTVAQTNETINLTDVNLEALFSLSKSHDLSHIVYYELNKRIDHWEGDIYRKFKQQYDLALFRHIKREITIEQIRAILEDAKIPFVFLKGVVLMDYYPESWMRTSSDIDVLVHKKDHFNACKAFANAGMTWLHNDYNCSVYETVERYHVELHHTLNEAEYRPDIATILDKVWNYSSPKQAEHEEYTMHDDMFYFSLIVHAFKHLSHGGCGVRFFLDLWILDHMENADIVGRSKLIEQAKLSAFDLQSKLLANHWLSGLADNSTISDYENYVLLGGVYGTVVQDIAFRKIKRTTGLRYYLSRVFLPYKAMSFSYPIIRKFPVILPFCWIVRWFSLFNPQKRRKALDEIRIERATDQDATNRIKALIEKLELP